MPRKIRIEATGPAAQELTEERIVPDLRRARHREYRRRRHVVTPVNDRR
jgi:hypothetical protein